MSLAGFLDIDQHCDPNLTIADKRCIARNILTEQLNTADANFVKSRNFWKIEWDNFEKKYGYLRDGAEPNTDDFYSLQWTYMLFDDLRDPEEIERERWEWREKWRAYAKRTAQHLDKLEADEEEWRKKRRLLDSELEKQLKISGQDEDSAQEDTEQEEECCFIEEINFLKQDTETEQEEECSRKEIQEDTASTKKSRYEIAWEKFHAGGDITVEDAIDMGID